MTYFESKALDADALSDCTGWREVVNPATGESAGVCPELSPRGAEHVIQKAHRAVPSWRDTPVETRQERVARLADAIDRELESLARLLTLEQGKPLGEARIELTVAALFLRYFSGLSPSIEVLEDSELRRVELHRKAMGVVAGILPWNYPILLAAFKIGPALVAGNTFILKPAPSTPLTSLRIGDLAAEIFPPGVFNVLPDDGQVGPRLVRHPSIAKIAFTGSERTGRAVMANGAETLKRMTLELGGNDAALVFGDVDVKVTAQALFASAFMNCGQTCIAVKRVYAHESIHDDLCEELAALAEATVVGNGLQPGVTIGPLQNRRQYERVRELMREARDVGEILAGGDIVPGPGLFLRPTIVRGLPDQARVVQEEQFGPILPILKFSDETDAMHRVNGTQYGLGCSIWSRDTQRAYRLAPRMEAGTVWINQHLSLLPYAPLAGVKASGLGSELGLDALKEYTTPLVVNHLR